MPGSIDFFRGTQSHISHYNETGSSQFTPFCSREGTRMANRIDFYQSEKPIIQKILSNTCTTTAETLMANDYQQNSIIQSEPTTKRNVPSILKMKLPVNKNKKGNENGG